MKMARLLVVGTMVGSLFLVARGAAAQSFHDDHGNGHQSRPSGELVRVVREVTRPFLDVYAAGGGGYEQFLGCVSGTQEGAMGVHYVNGSLVDGKIEAEKPEALLYEMRNGKLYLLGVEYVAIAEAWDAENPQPPTLLGQVFTYNTSPNRFGLPPFYALHVWAWKDNPNGTFVDWNPEVSCEGFKPVP